MRSGPIVALVASTRIESVKIRPEIRPVKVEGCRGRPPIGSGPPPENVAPAPMNAPLLLSDHPESITALPHGKVRLPPPRAMVRPA